MTSLRLLITTLTLLFTLTSADIHRTEIRSDSRSTIPISEFGFTHTGRLHLNLSHISFSPPDPNLSRIGFFLCTRDSWIHVIEQLQSNQIHCPLDSPAVKPIFTFNHLKPTTTTPSYDAVFNITDANQFTLVFSNCADGAVKVSVNVVSVMYNLNPKNNCRDYLSADREKKVLMVVIPLQVVANVAQVVIDETGPFGQDSNTWRQVFLLVDIICCCAVLFPIIWSIKKLREAAMTDGKAAVNLMKLTLFRQYYVVVICYIYFTRVAVYVLETITSYRYAWTSVLAAELATLAFYVFTGYSFRPKVHNPYFAIDDDDEEAAVEILKLEDEFEL
uniref:Putative lung seven transmembrane receptor-like protein n=1 Tax=Helianthus annuus TaxID=4232 RepID=A0A251U7C5_HELAN